MLDMNNKELKEEDFVLYPGGNARYGGLKLMLGIIVKITPKRVSLLTMSVIPDGKPIKATTKSGHKVLKCDLDFASTLESSSKLVEHSINNK